MTKGVDERIEECVLLWLGHVERMEIVKRIGECAGSEWQRFVRGNAWGVAREMNP